MIFMGPVVYQQASFCVCAPWARSNGCKSRTRPDSGKCIAEQQGCVLLVKLIEPPCTERYARWCERSGKFIKFSFLLDYGDEENATQACLRTRKKANHGKRKVDGICKKSRL